MKIARKEQKLLLYVVGLLLLLAVYFLYFSNKQTELDDLQDEVDSLYSEVQKLEEYDMYSSTYQKQTKEYYEEIENLSGKFPAMVKEEDCDMYMRSLETEIGVEVSNITMQPVALLSSFGVGERQKSLYTMQTGVQMSGSYDNLKQVINSIQTCPDKRNITALSAAYDSNTGLLSISATVNLYALSGKDKSYTPPNTGAAGGQKPNVFE